MPATPNREDAWKLLTSYNQEDRLLKHALAVEGTMRHFAAKYGEDPDLWGMIGLIHDLDYERYPEEHCARTERILQENDWPREYIRAVISHGYGLCTDVKPESLMEKTLYAIDELTGLVAAAALVRPSRSVLDLKPKSVKKKWKDKRFAAGVDRSVIENGAEMLGVGVDELIAETIEGMKAVADDIGLRGEL